jgi:sterol 3beta-glucosyltransferase
MRITLVTYGSRGDVQPYVALGVGLQRAGYAVRIAAPEGFADFVTGHGLDFAPLAGDPATLARDLTDRAGLNPVRTIQAVFEYAFPLGRQVLAQVHDACRDADAVGYSFLMTVAAYEAALARGVPSFFVQMYPLFVPTGAFPAMLFPRLPVGGPAVRAAYNRQTHRLFDAVFWQSNRQAYDFLRRTRYPDLRPLSGWPFAADPHPLALFGWSPHVIPPPGDWPDQAHVTGFWYLDAADNWQPPDDLAAFLADGPPPVYVGFGSMITAEIDVVTDIVLTALDRVGQRAVLLGGWGGLGAGDLPPGVLRIESAPHDWLFPRMAAVVHHGGAGTTAAGLRAGVPAVVCPFGADQAYWGGVVQRAGTGPDPIPRADLTVDRLAYALRVATTHGPMRQRAADLGARIRAEDGVGAAVGAITAYLQAYQNRR